MHPHARFRLAQILFITCAIGVPASHIEAQIIFGASSGETVSGALDFVWRDIDRDGHREMIELNMGLGIVIHKWNGVRWARLPAKFPPRKDGWKALDVADLDGDLDLDIVVVGGTHDQIWINDGSLCFSDDTPVAWTKDAGFSTDVIITDFNRDGAVDIIKMRDGTPNVIHRLDKDGRIIQTQTLPTPVPHSRSQKAVVADLDRDGDPDLLIANLGNQNRCYTNNAGTLADVTSRVLPIESDPSTDIAVADVDGDGMPDIVFANNGVANKLLKNTNGSYRLDPYVFPRSSGATQAIALGDVNGDGFEDVAFVDSGEQPVILINDGKGGFTLSPAALPIVSNPHAMEIRDIDRDKDQDLIVTGQLRSWVSYNRERQLETPAKTTVGGTLDIRVRSTPDVEPQPVIIAASPNLLNTPFVFQTWEIFIDPQNMAGIARFQISPHRSLVTYRIPVPSDSALVGLTLYLQGVIFDVRYTYYAVTNQDGTTLGR